MNQANNYIHFFPSLNTKHRKLPLWGYKTAALNMNDNKSKVLLSGSAGSLRKLERPSI